MLNVKNPYKLPFYKLNPNYAIDILLQSKTPAKYNATLTFAHLS